MSINLTSEPLEIPEPLRCPPAPAAATPCSCRNVSAEMVAFSSILETLEVPGSSGSQSRSSRDAKELEPNKSKAASAGRWHRARTPLLRPSLCASPCSCAGPATRSIRGGFQCGCNALDSGLHITAHPSREHLAPGPPPALPGTEPESLTPSSAQQGSQGAKRCHRRRQVSISPAASKAGAQLTAGGHPLGRRLNLRI